MGVRINKLTKLLGTFTGTSTDPLVTTNATTGAVDTANNLFGTLVSGQIWIGSVSNVPVGQVFSGAITVNNSGVTTLGSNVIVNANINPTAAIALTKLAATTASRALVSDASGFITFSSATSTEIGYVSGVTSAIQTQLNAKQATITGAASTVVTSNLTANIVAVSNGSGKLTSSTVTTTALVYIGTLTSDAQTQINNRLRVSLGPQVTGDIVYYNGSNWTNLPRGTNGQALHSTGSSIQWETPTINGIPIGGTTGQYLAKNSGVDFDASWISLTLVKVTDVTATAAEVNILSGVTTTTTQLNYLNTATGDIQTQLNSKQSSTLPNNSLWVGNASNVASVLAAGTNGQVLQISAGVPVWQTISGTGTVTSIDVVGGSTGLTTSGGPVSTSGTITFAGTLNETHGGTNQTTYTTGEILYASAANTLTKLGIGSSGQVLKVSAGIPSWGSNTAISPLTTKGDIYVYSTADDRLPVGTDGYHLVADSGEATGLKWVPVVSGQPFSDASALIKNASDATKLAILSASAISTGTTRTYILPDYNGTIALLGGTDGAALSKVDDTNVTLTLTGSPTTALLAATTLNLGWTGTLAEPRGGTNQGSYILGDILYSSATDTLSKLAGNTSATNKFLAQTGTGTISAAPSWVALVSGDIPNNAANTTGSAATLSPGRNINGTLFDGSTNITITAAAGTLTGATLNSTVTTSSLTSIGAQAQALDMGSHRINNVTDPSSAQDAATKNYVDTALATLDSKQNVAYASTSALPSNTYSNGASGVGATLTGTANGPLIIDSVTILIGQEGERVLVAGESTSANNGWYTITQVGVVAVSPYILTRATDSDQASEIGAGYLTSVIAPNTVTPGSSNNGKVFISVAADPFTVGTTALTFSQVGSTYSAGTGITLSGNTFSLTTPVAVTSGGTGISTTTQGDLLYVDASNSLAKLAKNTSSTRFLSNTGTSNNPAWAQVDLTTGVTGTLPIANGGTNNGSLSVAAGVVYYGDGTKLVGLAAGTSGQVLQSNGAAAPSWLTISTPITLRSTADYTLTNTASAQDIFASGSSSPASNGVSITNGQSYTFVAALRLNSMSTTSGNFALAFAGTATLSTSSLFMPFATKTAGPSTTQTNIGNTGVSQTTTNTVNTVGWSLYTGLITCTGSGTLIPQITLSQAAAAIVQQSAYLILTPIS